MTQDVSPKTDRCRNGHKRTAETIYVAPKTGAIGCRPCRYDAAQRHRKSNPNYFANENARHRFGKNREAAILRDGERCVECGMTRDEHKQLYNKDITVDHIDGNGVNRPRELKNNSLDNLQTMCFKCHSKKDQRRIHE